MLERVHLEILAAIKQHQTLTRAASALHLSQSALSHSIKKLEHLSDTSIWQKDGRTLRLTQAGERILKLAERVLPQFEHTEFLLRQIAKGERGILRIGMECHPCYKWLLQVIEPFLKKWPDVDIDVKQEFQFGALGALHSFEIDVLITPDPLLTPRVEYIPAFNYEHKLVVAADHPLAEQAYVDPTQLSGEVLYTYPIEPERLDIFTQFLNPANICVKQHKIIETTEIMLQMVAAGRGVCALPGWLIEHYANDMKIKGLSLGKSGINKQLFIGIRKGDEQLDYLDDFILLAQNQRASERETM